MNILKKVKATLACLLSGTMLLSAFAGMSAVAADEPDAQEGAQEMTYFKAYPKAEYETVSPDYSVTVNGNPVDTVAYFEYKDGVYRYSYAHLAYEGTAQFEIKNLRGDITDYNLSPHSYGIEATVSGDTISFSLEQKDSRYIVLRTWVGRTRYELFIACDPQIDYGLEELKTGKYLDTKYQKDQFVYQYKDGKFVDVVKDLGLDNTGATKLTTAAGSNAQGPLQDAINDLSRQGGGTLYFPAGTYTFVYLDAKDNVTIFLDEGAYLRGTGDRTDYTWNATGANGRQGRRLIHLRDASNFSLVGPGTIDGNIISLSYNSKNIEGVPSGPPTDSSWYPDGWNDFRTGIIDANGASNITLNGVTVKETTGWTFNITNSTNLNITNVKMLNDYEIVHSDGYDLVSCQNVVIDDCLGVCGDDVFCPKADNSNREMKNYLITDGVAYARGGAGCKVGVQARSKTTDIIFDNIDVVQGYRAFCIAHDEGQGAWDNIVFRNIRCEEIWIENTPAGGTGQYATAAFIIWTLGGGQGPVSNVTVENVTIENSKGQKATIKGESAAGKISGVTIKNLVMDGITINQNNYRSKINIGSNVEDVTFEYDRLRLAETYIYEAEQSTQRTGSTTNPESDDVSGGYMVSGLGTRSSLTIDVFAETAGPREIEVFYCSRGENQLVIQLNAEDAQVYDCAGTSETATSPNTVKLVADLNKGMNSLTFSGLSDSRGGTPNLDKVEVAMLSVAEKEAVAASLATIEALPTADVVTADNADAVKAAIEEYNKLSDTQKVFVESIVKLALVTKTLEAADVELPELIAIPSNNGEDPNAVVLPTAPTSPSEEPKNTIPWVPIAIAAVAVVAAGGIGLAVALSKKKSGKKEEK